MPFNRAGNEINEKGNRSLYKPALRILVGVTAMMIYTTGSYANTASLHDVLHLAEKQAPAIKAAYSGADAVKAKRRVALSPLLGQINAFVQDAHFNDNRLTRPISPPIDFSGIAYDDDQIAYGLRAQLPVDLSGRLRNNLHAVTHQSLAARAQADDVRLAVLDQAAALYRGLQQTAGQREALQQQARALRGHIKVAQAAIHVGRIAAVEKLRLVAELKTVEGELSRILGTETALRARLAALLDERTFGDTVRTPATSPSHEDADPGRIENRPDVKAASEQEQAASSRQKAARAAFFPDIVAEADWIQSQGYSGAGADDPTWQVTIQARLPIWTGDRRRAQVSQARAAHQAARHQQTVVREKARAEIKAAAGYWRASQAQYDASTSAVEAAMEVARIQTDRFEEGRLSAADLVDAEASLAGARSQMSTSLVLWWRSDDALRRAMALPPRDYGEQVETQN